MNKKFSLFTIAWLIFLFNINGHAGDLIIPHLAKQGTAGQLIVNKKPFLLLSGELGNSSASDLAYLRPIWPQLVKMHLNSVLAPIYWELIEPEQGRFDFTLVDSIIYAARKFNLKIVPLWFGSWKNSMSCYAPLWIKSDQQRFPRSRTRDGQALEILTPFSEENRNADARAFAALMKHIRQVDEKEQTVIMVQVENEIGMIPDARDYCDLANQAFVSPIPPELISYLYKNKNALLAEFLQMWEKTNFQTSGTFEQVFGKGLHTDELFMAWHFSRYTNFVAQAGKKEYPLPMYVNAALIRPGYQPGQYPSAGPLPHLMDIWRAGAPQIDFIAPDIYFKNFSEWCAKFDRSGNPLFIPEVDNKQSAANAFYAFAQHNAMGYSPFSIESLEHPENNHISRAYEVLHQLSPLILAHQGKGTMAAALLDSSHHQTQRQLGDFAFTIRHEYSWPYAEKIPGEMPRFGAMICKLADDEFIIAGAGVVITFAATDGRHALAGIGSVDEGKFVDGRWMAGRRLNGDQTHQGRHVHLPGDTFRIYNVKLYAYK